MKAIVREIFLHSIPISMNNIFRSLTVKYFPDKNYLKLKCYFCKNKQSKVKHSAFGFVTGELVLHTLDS